ncbi:uncharacterized protein LOC112550421 [Alligator sinensis]|uniref:Uncharacterized protein LOC112550421 n=1 Tax=Alligator sinensis TaxID=38654 RepID=A0A3Q0GM99_ALLSI|nr:uncharacterized protein LOC112550421 [Alligator sinensis]
MVMRNCIMVPCGCKKAVLGMKVRTPLHTHSPLHTSLAYTQLLTHSVACMLSLAHSASCTVACTLSCLPTVSQSVTCTHTQFLTSCSVTCTHTLSLTSHLHTSCLHSHCPSLVTRTLVARIHCPSLVTCTLVARTLSHSHTINYTDSVADVVHTGSLSFLFHFPTPRPAGRLARATPRPGPPPPYLKEPGTGGVPSGAGARARTLLYHWNIIHFKFAAAPVEGHGKIPINFNEGRTFPSVNIPVLHINTEAAPQEKLVMDTIILLHLPETLHAVSE